MLDNEIKGILHNGKRNVLWGGGKNGIWALLIFASLGISVDSFCDSDREKQGLRIFNKKIIVPEKILENQEEYNVVVTVRGGDEIEGILIKNGVQNYLVWKDIYNMLVLATPDYDSETISSYHRRISLYHIIRESYARNLVIYGTGKDAAKLQSFLKMLDVDIAYFVDDEAESVYRKWDGEVRPIYDLLYEKQDTFRVIVMPEKRNRIDILDKIGLTAGRDYDFHNQYTMCVKRKYILDPILGYNFLPEKERDGMPGIVEIGDGEFKIALLGGSTTDGGLYSFKSWGEILYEKLAQNGYSVKILNGGCAGYTTSQEMLKLIRDIVPLRPDVVIDYTGVNDADYQDVEEVFASNYQEELVKYMAEHIEYSNVPMETDDKYTLGINHHRQCFQVFADNIKMMSYICNGHGIAYLAFLQPWLGTKQNKISDYEYELTLNSGWDTRTNALWFCENVWPLVSGYAENATSLFDDESDVYIDCVHVNEHGNEIIALYMYDYLTKKGIVKKC